MNNEPFSAHFLKVMRIGWRNHTSLGRFIFYQPLQRNMRGDRHETHRWIPYLSAAWQTTIHNSALECIWQTRMRAAVCIWEMESHAGSGEDLYMLMTQGKSKRVCEAELIYCVHRPRGRQPLRLPRSYSHKGFSSRDTLALPRVTTFLLRLSLSNANCKRSWELHLYIFASAYASVNAQEMIGLDDIWETYKRLIFKEERIPLRVLLLLNCCSNWPWSLIRGLRFE
jgi:hypothetical protein